VPTGTTDALIPTSPAGGVFPELGINNAAVRDLEVQSGATVTIPATQALTVNGVLTNNGTVYVNNNGSLVQTTGSTLAGSGTYQVQRQGASGQRFNFWSSPITGQNGVPGTSYSYNPNAGTQDDSDDNPSDPGWNSFNGTMTPGVGYAGQGGGMATFTGTVNNGNIPYTLVYHAFDNTYSQTSPGTPFNLVGNPYPSAISAAQLITDNPTIDGTIYFWDDDLSGGTDYSRTDFAYWNGTGGLGTGAGSAGAPNGSISTAQGFYVRALSGGTLTFNNGQRVAGPNTQFLKPNGADSRLWLSVESADHFDQVLIGALEDATEEEDRLYDAIKMRSANGISLSAVGNDVEHAIMAFPPPVANKTIPLRVNTEANGTHIFKAQTIENFNEFALYFDDALTGDSYQIEEGVGIPIEIHAGEHLNRFYLNLVRTSFTGIREAEESPLTAYAANGYLTVGCAGCAPDASIELLDMSGRVVLSERNPDFEGGMSVTDISGLSTGVYVVRVVTDNQVLSQKIINQ
jgi:hypothetical protein